MRLPLAFLIPVFALSAPPDFRLPDTVRPERYSLDLTLLPDQPVFSGRIEIDVRIREASNQIWLNGKDLQVKSAWVDSGGARQPASAAERGGEFIGLSTSRPLGPGTARIGIEFTAKLDDKLSVGAYRRRSGSDWYAFTNFTAIEARRAFPCFDQPEFKTPWKLTMHVRQSDTAVANAPAAAETPEANAMKRVEFRETQPLASEVVAFAVGPFDVVADGTAGSKNIAVRIITPRGQSREAFGILGATRGILAQLEEYTGIPYPWDKLDHVAVLDMPFGAVENPGLITYRDRTLLAADTADTAARRHTARGIMAHEMAHQWFGNLVTQRWWDDVWLSEGFASWLGAKISDRELPDFEQGAAAVLSRARIMTVDTRPVRLDLHSRQEMQDVYSGIVYQKGAGVLRMVENWLGPERFQQGLRSYLRDHSFATATTADLAAALQAASGVDVSPVFASYLNQPGFPLVHARTDCAAKRILIEQESKSTWNTPVCIGAKCTLISGAHGEIPIESCPAAVWPNGNGAGYYRAQSDSLGDVLKRITELSTAERLSIAEDLDTLPAPEQLAALPALLFDENANVVAAAQRAALKLATTPGIDLDKLKQAVTGIRRGRRSR